MPVTNQLASFVQLQQQLQLQNDEVRLLELEPFLFTLCKISMIFDLLTV